MGKLTVTIGVGDPQGTRFQDVDVIVDTASTFTTVPATLLQELGVPIERTARARLADGRTCTVHLDLGHTMIRLEGPHLPHISHILPAERAQSPGSRNPGESPAGRRPNRTTVGAGRRGPTLIKEVKGGVSVTNYRSRTTSGQVLFRLQQTRQENREAGALHG